MDDYKPTLKERFICWLHRVTFCALGEHNMSPVFYYEPDGPWVCRYCDHVTGADAQAEPQP